VPTLQPETFTYPAGFPAVGLVLGDPAYGLKVAAWDHKTPTKGDYVSWFTSLKDASWVYEKFNVVVFCCTQMIGDILAAAEEAGCSSNPQHIIFLSDQGTGGRAHNSFHTHLMQQALVLFFDKTRPGKGGDKGAFGFDLKKGVSPNHSHLIIAFIDLICGWLDVRNRCEASLVNSASSSCCLTQYLAYLLEQSYPTR